MAGVNKMILVGNLGSDPELRYMPNGNAVTNFSIATSRTWKDKQTGEKQEATEWHRVSAFGKPAEIIAEYASKGSKMYIEGDMRYSKFTNKEGVEIPTATVSVAEFQFLSPKREGSAPAQDPHNQQKSNGYAPEPKDFDDDIPF